MADKFNPPIIDDALEELEEVEVIHKPPQKDLVIEDTLIMDDKTPAPAKEYDLKRNGKELAKTDTDYVYRYLDGTGYAYRLYHKESKTDTFVMYDPETKGRKDKNGKSIKPTPFRTKSQAVAHMLRELDKLTKDDSYKNRDVTFDMVWQMFLSSSHGRANETIRRYNSIYNHHIKAEFGERALNSIPTEDYNELLRKLHQTGDGNGNKHNGYSYAYVNSILKFVFLVVHYGYSKHIVSTENYIRFKDEIAMPTETKESDDKEIRVLNYEQIRKIKELLEPTDYYLPFIISLYGGLRPAETFALCFEDFDFDKGTVSVNKQIVEETTGKRIIKRPKTLGNKKKKLSGSVRTIELPFVVMREVKRRQKALEEARAKDPLVFEQNKSKFIDGRNFKEEIIEQPNFINVDSKGRYITAHSFSYYTKIIKRDICPNDPNLEDFSFYTFRKTHLSQMAGKNCPIGELMKRAGHTKVDTLYDNYYRRTETSKEALERALSEVTRELQKL